MDHTDSHLGSTAPPGGRGNVVPYINAKKYYEYRRKRSDEEFLKEAEEERKSNNKIQDEGIRKRNFHHVFLNSETVCEFLLM